MKRYFGAVLACLMVATVAFSVGTTMQSGDVPPPIRLVDEAGDRERGRPASSRAVGRRARAGARRARSSDRAAARRGAPAAVSPSRGAARLTGDDRDGDQNMGGTPYQDESSGIRGADDDAGEELGDGAPPAAAGDNDDLTEGAGEDMTGAADDDDGPEGGDAERTDDQPDGGPPGDDLDD